MAPIYFRNVPQMSETRIRFVTLSAGNLAFQDRDTIGIHPEFA